MFKLRVSVFLGVILALFLSCAQAQYVGQIEFSSSEIAYHERTAKRLAEESKACLLGYKKEHERFYNSTCWRTSRGKKVCLSKYYGDRRYSMRRGAVRSDGQQLEFLPDALAAMGLPREYANQMQQISCVGLALDCLEEGFNKTGQSAQWQRIRTFVRNNGVGGTALQFALAKIGWKTYYWNPAPYWSIEQDMARWDEEEKNWQSKGWHTFRYNRVMNRGTYWFNTVDNSTDLVGFGDSVPRVLRKYPFWVGTAHTGYHVFPGTETKVVEAHSTRHFTAYDNLEFSDFSPFRTGGGPRWTRTEKYRSGLIVFPPL